MKQYIKNFDELALSKERTDLLNIINSGYEAIDTSEIISKNFILEGDILKVKDQIFNLKDFDNIYLIGFGKASGKAIQSIENVLGSRISGGIVMDKEIVKCNYVNSYICSHPRPSPKNITASEELVRIAKSLGEKDLAIVVVSGGGSAMICWPESECAQGLTLYEEFSNSGGNISEMNILRKHLSMLKGGGLAKLLYPATVISLIFCDVPGDFFNAVASGPTYKDESTIEDALAILKKYNLPTDNLQLTDTPKEDKYFEKVHNVPVVTNTHAVTAMEKKARELGYEVHNEGAELYQTPEVILDLFLSKATPHSVVIGAGEPSVKVKHKGGKTGRCEHMTAIALEKIGQDDIFSSFASDGIDNLSVSAGAIADSITKEKDKEDHLSVEESIDDNVVDEFFAETKDQIITGETESNVSDLMILLRK